MKHITTWKPDTCDCIVHFEWDDEDQKPNKTFTAVEEFTGSRGETIRAKKCQHHQSISDHHEHFAVVEGENKGKNRFLKELLDELPAGDKKALKDEQGRDTGDFAFLVEPTFSFDAERKLVVDHPSLTPAIKARIKTKMTADKDVKVSVA